MTEFRTPVEEPPRRSAATRRRRSAHKQVAERQRRKSLRRWAGIVAAVIAVVAIAGVVLWSRREASPPVVGDVQTFADLPRGHTADPVQYAQRPPVGGPHDPVWQDCGFYTGPIRNENGVHTLEHGAIWITYRPDLPQAQRNALRDLARTQSYVLVSPLADLPAPIVASAWGKQLLLDTANDPRLADFVRQFRLDPAGPEPGAPCAGGTAETT